MNSHIARVTMIVAIPDDGLEEQSALPYISLRPEGEILGFEETPMKIVPKEEASGPPCYVCKGEGGVYCPTCKGSGKYVPGSAGLARVLSAALRNGGGD